MTVELYLGDCLEVMQELEDGSVDAVITDPPYGMGKADWDMQIVPVDDWLPQAKRLGSVALFTGVKGAFDYPKPDWIMAWVRLGSTQRNGKLRGFNNWEPILTYGLDRLSNDVIKVSNQRGKNEQEHPTQKPLKLMRMVIERLTQEGDTVLDPFMGSGTTGVACVQTGRNFIGIEIEPKYYEIAEKRIAEAQLQIRMEI